MRPKALRAACSARLVFPFGAEGGIEGGGGGVERSGGGLGADAGGGGGTEDGVNETIGDGVGANPDGFREAGGGIGGFFPIGGGLGFEDMSKEDSEADDAGLRLFRNCITDGADGAEPGGRGGADPGTRGALPLGGLGAAPIGGRGAELRDDSGSDMYGDLLSAPVSIPPAFRSFGIPPAKIPASCGGPLFEPPPSPPSLLLLARFGAGGGAKLDCVGLLAMPGTGGAPPTGAAGAIFASIIGAERSLTCATFFRRAPPSMLLSSAPYYVVSTHPRRDNKYSGGSEYVSLTLPAPFVTPFLGNPPGGGGGGAGGPPPRPIPGKGGGGGGPGIV